MTTREQRFGDALTWIEQNAANGIVLVARALAETSPAAPAPVVAPADERETADRLSLLRRMAGFWRRMATGEQDSKWPREARRALEMCGGSLEQALTIPHGEVALRLSGWDSPPAAPLPVETPTTPTNPPICTGCGRSFLMLPTGLCWGCMEERTYPPPAPAPLDDGGAASSTLAIVHDAASVLGDHARESRTHLIGQDETLGVCDSPRTGSKPHWRTLSCTNWRALDDGETGGRECASCGGRGWYPSPVWDSDVSCIACGGSGRARGPSGTPGGGT